MTDFSIADAHPGFRHSIPAILLPLANRYPRVALRCVELYEPGPRDTSMGSAHQDGTIRLNSYWFSRDPSVLADAARRDCVGDRRVWWHGRMVDEPEHVLTHEFGHLAYFALPDAERFTRERWSAATRNTRLAPAGYALANSVMEWWAEQFAALELGYAEDDEMRDLLAPLAAE